MRVELSSILPGVSVSARYLVCPKAMHAYLQNCKQSTFTVQNYLQCHVHVDYSIFPNHKFNLHHVHVLVFSAARHCVKGATQDSVNPAQM